MREQFQQGFIELEFKLRAFEMAVSEEKSRRARPCSRKGQDGRSDDL